MPGEVDRYNMRRYLSLTANIEGEDLGRVIDRLDAAIARAGQPPKGIEVELRGQVQPMKEMFQSLEIGLAVAVVVILIMLTAYFQAPAAGRDGRGVGAGGPLRRRAGALGHADDAEHRVVHGGDHGRRRGGLERDHAGQLRRPPPPRGGDAGRPGGDHRGQGAAPPDHHDRLRHDRGDDPDVARPRGGERAERPARPGRDRRHGPGDLRHAPGPAGRLHAPAGPGLQPIPLARPRRPGEHALRPDPPAARGDGQHAARTPPEAAGHRDHNRRHAPRADANASSASDVARVRSRPSGTARALVASGLLLLAAGCGHSDRRQTSASRKAAGPRARRARPPGSRSSGPSGATSG